MTGHVHQTRDVGHFVHPFEQLGDRVGDVRLVRIFEFQSCFVQWADPVQCLAEGLIVVVRSRSLQVELNQHDGVGTCRLKRTEHDPNEWNSFSENRKCRKSLINRSDTLPFSKPKLNYDMKYVHKDDEWSVLKRFYFSSENESSKKRQWSDMLPLGTLRSYIADRRDMSFSTWGLLDFFQVLPMQTMWKQLVLSDSETLGCD